MSKSNRSYRNPPFGASSLCSSFPSSSSFSSSSRRCRQRRCRRRRRRRHVATDRRRRPRRRPRPRPCPRRHCHFRNHHELYRSIRRIKFAFILDMTANF